MRAFALERYGRQRALTPSDLPMETTSMPPVGLTAQQALVEKAELKPRQKIFIQAGSGGVGTFAIQLAKHWGASVATTTSAANVAPVKGLGADVVLNSQDATALNKSLRVLKPGVRRRAGARGQGCSFLFMKASGA